MPRTPKQNRHKFCKFRNKLTANRNLHLNQFDHHEVDLASRFLKVLNCTSDEEGGFGLEGLDGLQLQVETLLSNVVVRKRHIKEEMNILNNTNLDKYRGMKKNQGYVADNNKELHTGPLKTTQNNDGRGKKRKKKNLSRTTGSFTIKVVHGEITFPPSFAPENLFSHDIAVEASAGREETNVCREPRSQSSSLCSMNLQLSSRETSTKGNILGDTADKRKFSASQTSEEEKEATKRDARERVMTIGGYSDPFCIMDPKRLQLALEEKEEAIACIKEKIRQIVKSKENVQEKEKDCLDEMRLVEEMIHFCEKYD